MKEWTVWLWIAVGIWGCGAAEDAEGPVDESEAACARLLGEVDETTTQHMQAEIEASEMRQRLMGIGKRAEGRCPEAQGWSRNALGVQEGNGGNFFQALEHYREARSFWGHSRPPFSEEQEIRRLRLDQNRATAYFHLGWFEHAEQMLNRVLRRWLQMNNLRGIAEVKMLQARLLRLTGKPADAARALDEAEALKDSLYASAVAAIHQERARLHQEAGDLTAASLALAEAVEALPTGSQFLPILWMDQAELFQDLGKWEESKVLIEKLRLGVDWAKQTFLEAHLLFLESRALWAAKRPQEALAVADSSLDLMDGTRQSWQEAGADFVALRRYLDRYRFELELQQNGPRRALEIFEKRRAQGLLDNLWRRVVESSEFETSDGESCSPAEVAWRLDQRSELDSPAEDAGLSELLQCTRRYRIDQVEAEPTEISRQLWSLEDLQRELGDSPLLALTMGSRGLYGIWWAPGAEPMVYETGLSLPKLRELTNLQDLRHKLENIERADAPARLGEHVLEPILERLRGYSTLWVVADGPMDGFPVGFLTRPDTGKPLFSTHAVSYLPSMTTLASVRSLDRDIPDGGILLLGNPVYSDRDSRWPNGLSQPRGDLDSARYGPLRKSAEEVRDAAGFHRKRGRSVTELTERRAVRSLLIETASRYRALHLATHAVSDANIPERSRILLSCLGPRGQKVERCDLYLNEISELNLQGQVVILSACESHVGRLRDGEGPLGLSRAFLEAGAGAVVAGVWKVLDGETARLMSRFHEHLAGGATVAEALRRSKVELMEDGGSPAVWAGFLVYGDGAIVL